MLSEYLVQLDISTLHSFYFIGLILVQSEIFKLLLHLFMVASGNGQLTLLAGLFSNLHIDMWRQTAWTFIHCTNPVAFYKPGTQKKKT